MKKKKNIKGFTTFSSNERGFAHLLLIIVLVVFSIAGIGYWAYKSGQVRLTPPQAQLTSSPTPTPNPTADWKTYTSSIYEVKYPNDLIIIEDEGSTLALQKWGPTQQEGTELYDGFAVSFQPKEIPDSTLEKYVDAKIEEINKQGVSKILSGPDEITVNNYHGLTYVSEGLGTYKIIILESSDKIIFMEIAILVSDPKSLGFQKTVDQILSTFKFTDQVDNSSQWKDYSIEEAGFSFSAPENLTVINEEPNPGNHTIYIQNYGFNSPPPDKYFQLYIIFNPNAGSQNIDLEGLKTDLEPNSIEVLTIDGYKALRGQIKGQRNRFVTYIAKGNTLVSAFTSEPTKQNEELSKRIISTFDFK